MPGKWSPLSSSVPWMGEGERGSLLCLSLTASRKRLRMTKQESFKRRIRTRMVRTGERYAEARRILIEQSTSSSLQRPWVAAPELSDDAIRSGTGLGWDQWCDLIDAFVGRDDGHKATAGHVRDEHGVGDWWVQAVTVGYERITGRRLPHQMADGTFTANKSRMVKTDGDVLRQLLLDTEDRAHLFPDVPTQLKSKPTSKVIRIAIGPGVAMLTLDQVDGGRVKVRIEHTRLPAFDDVEEWKFYWSEWLDAIEE